MGVNSPSAYGNVSVTSTATLILGASPGRRGFIIFNNGANAIFIGMDANVTTSNGVPIQPLDNYQEHGTDIWMGNIYGITSTGSADIRTWEVIQ